MPNIMMKEYNFVLFIFLNYINWNCFMVYQMPVMATLQHLQRQLTLDYYSNSTSTTTPSNVFKHCTKSIAKGNMDDYTQVVKNLLQLR
jgi:hypothetical protein